MNIKITSKLRKGWDYMSGKKTLTGVALHISWFVIHRVAKFEDSTSFRGHEIIASLTGTGIIHKLIKHFKK